MRCATRMTPKKGGCMASAPALHLTTSLRGDFVQNRNCRNSGLQNSCPPPPPRFHRNAERWSQNRERSQRFGHIKVAHRGQEGARVRGKPEEEDSVSLCPTICHFGHECLLMWGQHLLGARTAGRLGSSLPNDRPTNHHMGGCSDTEPDPNINPNLFGPVVGGGGRVVHHLSPSMHHHLQLACHEGKTKSDANSKRTLFPSGPKGTLLHCAFKVF